jgi:hypothetical protein
MRTSTNARARNISSGFHFSPRRRKEREGNSRRLRQRKRSSRLPSAWWTSCSRCTEHWGPACWSRRIRHASPMNFVAGVSRSAAKLPCPSGMKGTAGCEGVRKCHSHKNQPAREQQIEQIQWLTAKTPRARRAEEINKFTQRFLGVLGVFAVRIGVEPPHARDRDVLERRGWERGDLAGTGRVPLCGDERVLGIGGADGAARSLFDPDRSNSCAKKIKS